MKSNEQKSISTGKLILSLILVFSVGAAVGFAGSTHLDTTDASPDMDTADENPEESDSEDNHLNAQAGVTFDDQGDSLIVQLVSIQQADRLYVVHPDGTQETLYDSESRNSGVGDTVTLENLDTEDQVIVVGVLDGQESIIQTYTM